MRYLGVAFKLVRGGSLVVVGWLLWRWAAPDCTAPCVSWWVGALGPVLLVAGGCRFIRGLMGLAALWRRPYRW